MAGITSGIRFVRCPKCHNLLMEFPDVPLYKCGGCGTALQAKNRVASREGSLDNASENLSDSRHLSNALTSSSTKVDDGVEEAGNGKGKSSEHGEKSAEESDQFDPRSSAQSQPDETLQAQQGHDRSRSSSEIEKSSESITLSNSSEQHVIDRDSEGKDQNGLRSTTRSSYAYDGSASSPDDGRRDHIPQKYLLLSKRTFKRSKVLDSVDSIGKEGGESNSENNKMTTDTASLPKTRNFPPKSSKESNQPSARYRSHVRQLGTSLGSEDFHSVQNSMESVDDVGPSESPAKDPVLNKDSSAKFRHLEHNQMKILRKVDELRDVVNGLFTKTVEGKGVSHLKHQLSLDSFPMPPRCICLHCLPECRTCPHNICCHQAQTHESESENFQCKEKRRTTKSYCRPILRGAPFVICYKCWNLLQLPADFVVSRKRLHKLRCGACSEVLVFSFKPRDRTAPQTPIEAQHPPSEVENNMDTNGNYEPGDPISYSEEYGLSFGKSYSSGGEPALPMSRDSSDEMERRDGKQVNKSQLHRLMGYSSASELLFQTIGFDGGYESREPSTPHFDRPFEEDGKGYGLNRSGRNTPNSLEIHEKDVSSPRLRSRGLHGLLKKGIWELNHGLESLKLKGHSNG